MPDKIKELNERLKKVQEDFKKIKDSGINEEILIIYLQAKTKLSKKDIKKVIDNVDLFFDDLITDEAIKKL